MNILSAVCFLAACIAVALASCHSLKLQCYETTVNDLVNKQIKVELKGHYTYLHLSYLFQQHNHYYPKVSKYFREKSDEEMQHAEKFITYQNQRGGTFEVDQVKRKVDGACAQVVTLKDGFACAKELEIEVTRALTNLLSDVSNVVEADTCVEIVDKNRDLILGQAILVTIGKKVKALKNHACRENSTFDKVEYVELAEMISHDFLGHQIEDTKELANFESTLNSFNADNEQLGSFLADKYFNL